jgi:hypothetical protein
VKLDFEDEIIARASGTRAAEIVHESTRAEVADRPEILE